MVRVGDVRGLLCNRVLGMLPDSAGGVGLIVDSHIHPHEGGPGDLCEMDSVIWILSHAHEDWEETAAAIQHSTVSRVILVIDDLEIPEEFPEFSRRQMLREVLEDTGKSVRTLRHGYLMENLVDQWDLILSEGYFSHVSSGNDLLSMVCAADLARLIVEWLEDKNWSDPDVLSVQGDRLSFHMAAEYLSQAMGHPVAFEPVGTPARETDREREEPCGKELRTTPTTFAAWLMRD